MIVFPEVVELAVRTHPPGAALSGGNWGDPPPSERLRRVGVLASRVCLAA
jgi:hypothetical protein